ncbi:MAG: hypothetical protein ACLFV1_04285 [Thiohalophilus sp.]
MQIVIIQGNPDHSTRHDGHALAKACAQGARKAGHEMATIEVAALPLAAKSQ